MKANELRLGNWVDKDGEQYQISSATIVQLERGESDAQPIPLTEEWLERLGFVKDGDGWSHDRCFKVCLIRKGVAQPYDISLSMWVIKGINYVHHLQNLYFALTGEELTTKEL